MPYEVEMKFPLSDVADIQRRLQEFGATEGQTVEQSDAYYAHPCRDFDETDEAFRIRRVGDENRLTYKGPLIDSDTKSRKEIEVAFAGGSAAAESMAELVIALGFTAMPAVVKQRTTFHWSDDIRQFELVVDRVETLGSYLEIETFAEESNVDDARDAVKALAARLGLSESERRSYLQLQLSQS